MTDSTPSSFKTLLLDSDAVARKLTRIALQIREANFDETRLLLAGVKNRGLELAHRLQAELAKLAPELEVVVDYIRMNKDNPVHDEITTGMDPMLWKDEVVVRRSVHVRGPRAIGSTRVGVRVCELVRVCGCGWRLCAWVCEAAMSAYACGFGCAVVARCPIGL